MNATVILTKCKTEHKLFGIRAEQREDGAWYATWAFKVSEETAAREKFDGTEISGDIYVTTEYPKCPHCGAKGFFQCASCGRTTCWDGEAQTVCGWCGNSAETEAQTKLDGVHGGGF